MSESVKSRFSKQTFLVYAKLVFLQPVYVELRHLTFFNFLIFQLIILQMFFNLKVTCFKSCFSLAFIRFSSWSPDQDVIKKSNHDYFYNQKAFLLMFIRTVNEMRTRKDFFVKSCQVIYWLISAFFFYMFFINPLNIWHDIF